MSEPEPASQEFRPPELTDQVDRLCDQFEAALRHGHAATIEEFLARFPVSGRPELLLELLALEIDFRRGRGEAISFLTYYRRFPDATTILDRLQSEWNLRDSSGFIAVRDPVKLDINTETIAFTTAPRQKIKQFELLSILGTGGFGTVWRAKDTLLQREVAVKVPRKDRVLGMNMSLFLREARSAAKLRHPNIVAIHEVGEEDSSAYIVSDLVDGVSLRVWLETLRPSTTESAMLVAKLATAAHHAHERGIIHRDLKPANVLIDRHCEPHIADFGLAKRDTAEDSLAVDNQLVGTPAYMAPEQARGDHKAIDRRTDVYALGAILYEMLTGQRAFHGEMSLMLNQIQHVPPLSPRKIKPEIPRELEAICLKCLAKDPAQRYATAEALADDLHRHIGGETLHGIPAAMPLRVQKWVWRNRRFVLNMTAIALVASMVTIILLRRIYPPVVPVDLRTVEFTTDPPGCEVTVVATDPRTGEPDPTKIQNAKGRTPLTMDLAPGDYLVVAVLNAERPNEVRFNEVHRHVPPLTEKMPMGRSHQFWKVLPSGVVTTATIRIPRPDLTLGMGFVEGTARLSLPNAQRHGLAQDWRVPSFFVDLREISIAEIRKARTPRGEANELGVGPSAGLPFDEALAHLEAEGKHLPTAAELYYLSVVVCPLAATAKDEVEPPEVPCGLADGRQIEGLHGGLCEWTTTRPGGPFSGMALSDLPDRMAYRMTGAGKVSSVRFQMQKAYAPSQPISARGVRSIKPRRNPEDFIAPAGANSK